jgi:hypothetical protein
MDGVERPPFPAIKNQTQHNFMKQRLGHSILLGVILAASSGVAPCGEGQPPGTSPRLSREDAVLVTVTASVEAVDLEKREVRLKGPLGNTATFTVDQRVKRLNEVKVGDLVQADYYLSIAAELRPPTPEEEKTPFVELDAVGKAPPGSSPAAGGLRRFKVVATIEGLDRPTETITVKGPQGNYVTARVADPSRLTQMRIGEKIIVTCTEALAISLEKVRGNNAK